MCRRGSIHRVVDGSVVVLFRLMFVPDGGSAVSTRDEMVGQIVTTDVVVCFCRKLLARRREVRCVGLRFTPEENVRHMLA